MRSQRDRKARALRLIAGARLERDPSVGLKILRHPTGIVRLNDAAAAILALCDGHHTRHDVLVRLGNYSQCGFHARHVNAFIDAARKLAWITEGEPDLHIH